MKTFTSDTQKKGEIGETAVCHYLVQRGYRIIERNFTRKWGEIDIVAWKAGVTHFVEVKSVSCENDDFRPEDQMHRQKQIRLMRTVQTYVSLHNVADWQFDVACVFLDMDRRMARVRVLNDIILG